MTAGPTTQAAARCCPAGCGQRGSATVLAAVLVLVVLVAAGVAAAWAGAVDLRHRARVAADLAALAGAGALAQAGDGCGRAAALAAANGATALRCTVTGEVLEVVVGLDARVRLLGRDLPVTATARARAGPAEAPDPPGW